MSSMTGQHPSAILIVLRNHELLTNVFRQYLPSNQSSLKQAALREGQIQLRNCALVCKSFKEPALSCLWAYLHSLIPLVAVLPNVQIVDNAYYFHGKIPPHSPFRQYAAKVRILDLEGIPMCSAPSQEATSPTISPHLFFYVMNELEGRPMLPCLKKIMVTIHAAPAAMDSFAILPLLCSDVVQTLGVYGSGFSNPLFATNCLPAMSLKLGSLKDLIIKCSRRDAGPHLFDAMPQLKALESLRVDVPLTVIPPRALLKALKSLGRLKALQLDLHFPHHKVDDNSFQLGATDFGLSPTLNVVVVTSRLSDKICPCIPRFLLERATKILLVLPRRRNTLFGDYSQIASSLSKIATLNSVRVQSLSNLRENVESVLPFFTQLSLQDFKLELPLYSDEPPLPALIDQAFMERPSDPNRKTLKNLYLIHDGPGIRLFGVQEDGITLACLNHVARKAKGLERLSVVLRSSFFRDIPGGRKLEDWLSVLRSEPESTSALQTLAIYDGEDPNTPMRFEDASSLAQILDLLFPRLASIKPYRDDQTLAFWTQRWAYIENLRKAFKAARAARA